MLPLTPWKTILHIQ